MTDLQDQRATRREYTAPSLRRVDLADDPLEQFAGWFGDAVERGIIDATAMTLATATRDAVPSVRVVLMKHYDEEGFCWYSDARSQKSSEILGNPVGSLLFYWRELSRQVRVTGQVERLPDAQAQEYFDTRPRDSQFAAAASIQSAQIDSRDELVRRMAAVEASVGEGAVPRPGSWAGWLLKPQRWEFWQGREGRLHDRFRYVRRAKDWSIARLQP
ncbi:MAG: pyridoxamine 5'-phosphate oxidase [Pseudomonadales bacterium]|nr:pyridoxamine 5'-phosphate oxidase [Pseudomonadales bacterium]MDP6470402.1 pyridoxamine 5'-phosphate oxidase [Pseudomonadales bacterium]MDP6827702.1 pyridoxamine 5'-phosphate oxidase [Pseudomonadales bacterium]MDP6973347.1 pyridoxamine 5'-phosphate oxidase [Pseudomonadales bacterium]